MTLGVKGIIGVAHQNSFGTAPSVSSVMYLPFLSESIGLQVPPLYNNDFDGVIEEASEVEEGPRTIGGDLTLNAGPITLGQLLKSALGDPTTTVAGSSYQHVFVPRSGDFDIYSAQRPCAIVKTWAGVNTAELLYNMALGTLELSCAAGELLKVKAGFVGGVQSYIAPPTVSYPAGRRVPWDVASIQVGSSTGIAARNNWRNFTVTVDNALEAKHNLANTQYPARIERTGFRKIAISGTMVFDDLLEYDAFLAQSERRLIISFVSKDTIMTNTRNLMTISIPSFRFKEFKKDTAGPGRIEAQFSGDAVYNSGSGHAFQFTLANTYAAY